MAATVTAFLACVLAWASRTSFGWRCVALITLALTLATPGPVAGMALVLAYRNFPCMSDSPAVVAMAEALRNIPDAVLIPSLATPARPLPWHWFWRIATYLPFTTHLR